MSGEIEIQIKVTAPPGAPEGAEEKIAGEIIRLAEILAEIAGSPKPKVRIERHEQDNQGR